MIEEVQLARSNSIKPNSFRAEYVQFKYNHLVKISQLEARDKNIIEEELNNFSNEAIDDPYKAEKTYRGRTLK